MRLTGDDALGFELQQRLAHRGDARAEALGEIVLLDAVAALNSRIAAVTGSAPMLTPPKLRELRHPDWVADNSAITAATGWTPAVGLRAGLELLKMPL